jgi:molybdopterin synthase sulfur carrier subunit
MSEAETVHVLLFGALRDRLGAGRDVAERVSTVSELWAIVTRERPELRDHRGLRVARNLAYCDWDATVEPGDEVAFMPPLCGGAP